MAKSGVYFNGRELLECELEKLDRTDKLQSMVETNEHNRNAILKSVLKKSYKTESESALEWFVSETYGD